MLRRRFLTAPAGALITGSCRKKAFELDEATIGALVEGMRSGKYTSRRLVELYLGRIEDIDRGGPLLRSIIELNPDASSIAADLDSEYRDKGPRGPLHGIPVLLKDNLDTGDRMQTTAGSLALAGHRAQRDSAVAARLRAAGAILLGKTNLSEWANFRSTRSTSGWSGRGGQTRNPYALDRNPCGSSSGSAVSVAANLCAAAIGTETDGSIVCPSSINGIVGIKPTLGLVGGRGIIPIAHSQDTAGPMARTVRDAAILLDVIREKPGANYSGALNRAGLRGVRIGMARNLAGSNEHAGKLMKDAVAVMKEQGALVEDVQRALLSHRSCERRPLHRRQLYAGGGGRLSEHQRADGLCERAAGGDFVLWGRICGSDTTQHGVCL